MSQMLNINGSDDPSYRYKMPRLIGKIEGRGNGIKTVIVNASDIAQALHRPTSQVTKFFGCELGAQSRYEKDADRAIVNGAFETSLLQEKLTIYIDKFVLCSQCNNPETQQELRGKKKAALVWLHCIACGADTEADNGHKLCTAIIKEMTSAGGDAPSRKKERKQRAAARAAGGDNGDDQSLSSADQSSTADSSSVSLSVSSSSKDKKSRKDKKSKKDKKEKKSKKDKKDKKDKKSKKDKNDDDLSSVDGNGVSEAQQQLQALSIDDVAALDKAVAELRARITSESPPTAEDAVKQALLAQSGAALRKVDTIAILFFAAVADQSVDAFTPYLPGLALLAQSPAHQLEVLGCLEEAVARADDDEKRENAIKLSPVVLKALYDADVVEEDVIRGWHSGEREPEHVRTVVDAETVAALKKHTKLIVDWLATVESESEDEDDEEDQDGDAAGAAAPQDGEADVDDDDDDDDKEEVAAVEPESVFGAPAAGAESDTDSSDSD